MEFITHFKDPNVANYLSHRNDKYVVVPVDNAPNNAVFVCKSNALLNKGIRYLQLTWQLYMHPDNTYERGNPGQSWVWFVFL